MPPVTLVTSILPLLLPQVASLLLVVIDVTPPELLILNPCEKTQLLASCTKIVYAPEAKPLNKVVPT